MKVCIKPIKGSESVAKRLIRRSKTDKIKSHEYEERAKSADMIILTEQSWDPRGKIISKNKYYNEYDNCYIYSIATKPSRVLPGVYVSMPKKYFDREIHRSYSYLRLKNEKLDMYNSSERKVLVSFMGSVDNKVRKKIANMRLKNSYIENTRKYKFFPKGTGKIRNKEEIDKQEKKYAKVMNQSKFVLCPRGSGPSSFRLYEAMYCGCVPVVISDSWVPPNGPSWDKFSIRVKESNIKNIPSILEKYERHFDDMSTRCSEEWKRHFSYDVMFDKIVNKCVKVDRKKGVRKYTNKLKSKKYWIVDKIKEMKNKTYKKIKRNI